MSREVGGMPGEGVGGGRSTTSLDLPGVALVSSGVVALVWAFVRANTVGWASAEVAATLLAGALLIAAFLAWESRSAQPMLPLRLLRIRAFAAGSATAFLMTGAIFGGAFMVSLLPDASADVALCHLAFMLLLPIKPVVEELARVLRPRGVFSAVVGSPSGAGHVGR